MSLKTEKSEIHRLPARGYYDRDTVYRILDENFLCHVAFALDGEPFVIPTSYGRDGDYLYLHGSVKSRMLSHLASGGKAAISVTQIDGIVLARSVFHSSMNYQSVVVYGCGEEVTAPAEKLHGLRIVTEHIWPGRWSEARQPDSGELNATAVVKIPLQDGAAKIRSGPAKDNAADYDLNIWAGVVPIESKYLAPIPDSGLSTDIPMPASLTVKLKP